VVDTGGSLVVLRESPAALAGVRPQPRDYTATAVTANGRIKAAPAKIDRIEVGGITDYDVPALVLPDECCRRTCSGRLVSLAAQALRIRQRAPAARTVVSTLEISSGALSAPPALGYGFAPFSPRI